VSDKAAFKGSEENGDINRGLLKGFLLLRTVVSAICEMGERVLPTVEVVSETAKTRAIRGGERAKRPLETRTPKPNNRMKDVRPEGGGVAS